VYFFINVKTSTRVSGVNIITVVFTSEIKKKLCGRPPEYAPAPANGDLKSHPEHCASGDLDLYLFYLLIYFNSIAGTKPMKNRKI